MEKMQFPHNYRVFSASAKWRLTVYDLDRFPDDTLFHHIARRVCRAGCLPRKELYEAWEIARRVRRLFRGGRVVDLGAGHGPHIPQAGYRSWTQSIFAEVTPKNRLLLGRLLTGG
jgi:hypothetical protein